MVAAKKPTLLDRPESPLPGFICNEILGLYQDSFHLNSIYVLRTKIRCLLTVLTSNANVQRANSVLNSWINMTEEKMVLRSLAALKQGRMTLSWSGIWLRSQFGRYSPK